METNNLIRFVQSLVFLPVMAISLSFSGIHNIGISPNVLVQKVNIEANGSLALNQAMNSEADLNAQILKAQAEAIDAYFRAYDMPLEGMGMKMAEEAEKNGLDYRLIPAIAVIESTGGKFACKNTSHSFLGWGSCKISFNSDEQAIEIVAWNLGGNNPNTDQHYAGKGTKAILQKYNPPYVASRYAQKVMRVMDNIGEESIVIEANT